LIGLDYFNLRNLFQRRQSHDPIDVFGVATFYILKQRDASDEHLIALSIAQKCEEPFYLFNERIGVHSASAPAFEVEHNSISDHIADVNSILNV